MGREHGRHAAKEKGRRIYCFLGGEVKKREKGKNLGPHGAIAEIQDELGSTRKSPCRSKGGTGERDRLRHDKSSKDCFRKKGTDGKSLQMNELGDLGGERWISGE